MRRFVVCPALLTLVAAIALCALPGRASAQGWYADWTCRSSSQCAMVMGSSSGTAPRDGSSFSTRAACDAWGQTYIPGGYSCRQGGSSGGASFSLSGSPARVTTQSIVLGGFTGAMLGSLAPKADTTANGYWDAGAAAGTSLILAIGVLKNAGHWSRAGSAVAGAIAGGAGGAAVGIHSDGEILPGSPQDLSTPSKVGNDAAIGAAAGAVVGFVFPKSEFSQLPGLRRLGLIRVINSGRRLGFNITW